MATMLLKNIANADCRWSTFVSPVAGEWNLYFSHLAKQPGKLVATRAEDS